MRMQNYGTKGFTLMEILLAAGLAVVVGTLLIMILAQNNGFFYKQSAIISEGLSLNDAMQKMNYYIRQSVAAAPEYVDEGTIYTSNGQTLVLKLPSLNGGEILENTYDFVVIFQDPENSKILRLKVFLNPQSSRVTENLVLTTLVSSYSFKYLDRGGTEVAPSAATSIEATLTVLSQTGSIGSSRTSSSVTTLRNTSL